MYEDRSILVGPGVLDMARETCPCERGYFDRAADEEFVLGTELTHVESTGEMNKACINEIMLKIILMRHTAIGSGWARDIDLARD